MADRFMPHPGPARAGARLRILLPCLLLGGLAGHRALANDYDVQVSGTFYCRDATDNSLTPLSHTRVEIYDSDCHGSHICDDFMGAGYTDANGHFSIAARGGDPGGYSWSRPDVYAEVVYTNDQGIRLTNEIDYEWSVNTPEHDHDNVEGSLDLGVWHIGSDVSSGNSTKCGVYLRSRDAYRDYATRMGGHPPAGHYDVMYWSAMYWGTPWTTTDTTRWPTHYPTGSVNAHEFAHSVRHAADGSFNHFVWDSTRFLYARFHSACDDTNEGFAFNEGWAEYWAGEIQACGDGSNMRQEGNVAAALKSLESCPGITRGDMASVLLSHPGSIHSYAEFRDYFLAAHPGCALNTPVLVVGFFLLPFFITRDAQDAMARTAIAEIASAIDTGRLEKRAADAAATRATSCLTRDCTDEFQAVIEPFMLDAAIRQAELFRSLVERQTRASYYDTLLLELQNGTLEERERADRDSMRQALADIATSRLQAAIDATARLRSESRQAESMTNELRATLEQIRSLSREGKPLPRNALPVSLLAEDRLRRAGFLFGDLDGQGTVTILDAVLALRIAAGLQEATPAQLRSGDLSGAGRITLLDVVKILRRVVLNEPLRVTG